MTRVVFICVENSCRSQMAEGFARRIGEGIVEAHSAGSRPSGRVNPPAIASMMDADVDITAHSSIGLEDLPEGRYDYAITMGCGDECPNLDAAVREDWEIEDPKNLLSGEFARVRDQVRARVEDLIVRVRFGAEE